MNQLFLVCNAHLDPVWQWEWDEGAAAAIATFRTAADFCEEFDGFVFCHNEALLYHWTEEYDPVLFKRIQDLVADGKWHIMGGWFLQPDCNMPSGESMLRQALAGRRYFRAKFDVEPKIALNFDSFGHSRGMVQILNQCGYDGYLFMRPDAGKLTLPERNFYWEGFDGSRILAHRLDKGYNTLMGEAVTQAEKWVKEQDESVSLFTWGIGNHGGGPSRIDLQELERFMERHSEIQIRHSTPEAFFEALREDRQDYPIFNQDLRSIFVGCYTSQVKIKQLHRRLENELYATEKLLAAASSQGLLEYPAKELEEAEYDQLTCEFHDILPGTSVQPGEEGAMRMLSHGLEIVSRLRMRGFMAMLAGERKAGEGEIPIFVYNPHPYPVTDVFTCEYMPANQNWSQEFKYTMVLSQDGVEIPAQEEKENSNLNLDWRKRVTFRATLKPSGITRFDGILKKVPKVYKQTSGWDDASIVFDNGEMLVQISRKTGLVERYCVDGVEYVKPDAFSTVVFRDTPDPWLMTTDRFDDPEGRFVLAEPKMIKSNADGSDAVKPGVRIVEDGPVRVVVETEFVWKTSTLIQTYRLPKQGTHWELEQRVLWHEQDRMVKLEIPTLVKSGEYWGQNIFGADRLFTDGRECVSQKWCGLFNENQGLTVINDGIYGSHCESDTVYLSLLRSAGYCVHPIGNRPLVDESRFIPRISQGEHVFRFRICGSDAALRRKLVDTEAQLFNEKAYVLNVFPGGNGKKTDSFVTLSDRAIQISAMYRENHELVIRLWNAAGDEKSTWLEIPDLLVKQEIKLPGYRFQTYLVKVGQGLIPVDPVHLK